MSRSTNNPVSRRKAHAAIFASLGDQTRLLLVSKLGSGEASSISQLSADSKLTRQAITKHLRVLERAGIVRCSRVGRETQFTLDPKPIEELKEYLDLVSKQWDNALSRLKTFLEK